MAEAPARIVLTRRARPVGDVLREYRVVIDDAVAGAIRVRQTRTFEVPPGEHTVRLEIDWRGSRRVEVELRPGEEAELVCSARRPFRIDPLRKHEYILLDVAKAPVRPEPPPPPLPPGAPTDAELQAAWETRGEAAERARELRLALQKAVAGDSPLEAKRLRSQVDDVVAEHERAAAEVERLRALRPDWHAPA